MHFQILYSAIQGEFKALREFTDTFTIIGNPQSGFSRNIECLINVEDNEEELKKIGYYISLYGLIILIGTALFLIIFEILFFIAKKHIKSYQQLL